MTTGDPNDPNQNPQAQPPGYPPPGGYQPPPQPNYGAQPGGYPPSGGYQQPPSPISSPVEASKGFFASLFDFNFNSFVTPSLVKVVYILGTILLAIGVLVFVISSFANDPVLGIIALVVAPIVGLVYLAFLRVTLELYYAVVRMSEDVHRRDGRY
ncbi:DUF4282 domain-containing protein [Gordonia sp. LSe1-13]|uniref:DUF4282 domain-containing protein n=1 Tax=Gordonia sesuvii TaxID=3116777 RepID=A0ABU7MA41_9ACTN|nr:DUF4282 domain-containing protein [Gordonia sp. LSe1-13]